MTDRNDEANLLRLLQEGFGAEAWHGPTLQNAIAGVGSELALWRPGPDRHNIAEITLHVGYWVHVVRTRVLGKSPGPFLLPGEDWSGCDGTCGPSWHEITATLEQERQALVKLVGDLNAERVQAAMPAGECFRQIFGTACHAIYHAGQIQLIRKLRSGA
ncbi:MAG: DinB family protein [Terriglobales bacterium]